MPDRVAQEILTGAGRALAHTEGRDASLQVLLDAIAGALAVGSAAIVLVDGTGRLVIAVACGLPAPAASALAAAIGNPDHPIARTVATGAATFDVRPTAPGGPALRSHVPLVVTRAGTETVLGVLALAHDDPIEAAVRPLVVAGADLAAAVVQRYRSS